MPWQLEFVLALFLLASAIAAIELRDLLAASIATAVFSFVMATIFVALGAVDVGFTEAVVGAGVVGVYYIAMVLRTTRRTKD
jgi:energy-converting hydrogenase B subunit D